MAPTGNRTRSIERQRQALSQLELPKAVQALPAVAQALADRWEGAATSVSAGRSRRERLNRFPALFGAMTRHQLSVILHQ